MSTEELVDELCQRFSGWNRDGEHGVLRYLNSAHDILMSMESQQTLIFDPLTGKLPPLNTTAGVFSYTMPTDVWRVSGILVEVTNPNLTLIDYGTITSLIRTSYKNSEKIGGVQYAKIPYIRSWDRVNDLTLARVMFTKDPLDQTDFYYRQSYKCPVQILSESIQPEVPAPWDFDMLLPAAAKLIEGVQNGNYDEARRIVRHEIKKELWKVLDSGDQGDMDFEPVSRDF